MTEYGFLVMGLGHLKSAGGRQDDTVDRYVGYSGDGPVSSPPWQTFGTLRDDMLRACIELPSEEIMEGIPVQTRHPYKSGEYLMAKKLSDEEMDLLIESLNENGGGLRFYRKEAGQEAAGNQIATPTSS